MWRCRRQSYQGIKERALSMSRLTTFLVFNTDEINETDQINYYIERPAPKATFDRHKIALLLFASSKTA